MNDGSDLVATPTTRESAPSGSAAEVRLRRLWKGTLLVGAVGDYALLLGLLFVHYGWRPALLALFLVAVAQFFRYIANDVDRIGWDLANRPQGPVANKQTARYQSRLLWLLFGLAQAVNLALIGQAALLGGLDRALATLFGLALVELLFALVRRVNRQTAFEQASFGLEEPAIPGRRAAPSRWDETQRAKLNRKLAVLEKMAAEGEISERAYKKARDKHLVRSIMEEER